MVRGWRFGVEAVGSEPSFDGGVTRATLRGCSAVYFWPKDKQGQDENGKLGTLHVRCAVADGRWPFLSSANLTEYAFTINLELGVLVTGGKLPAQVQEHFDWLVGIGILTRV
jgi:phosphatidylserine/phosphatidylglycerophosphate/cardiolipin synthase-like enzyme